eukprot:TRINITY_DN2188_c0_g1_i1.p1 TRINITY_DN2188_c0_g1~~TRINITY_DN2188_c0_g1_i1.p1  ORF type:complete len:247 (+),score=48.14 TRINITY_DN2188_c0_g1_i1:83-823(+)
MALVVSGFKCSERVREPAAAPAPDSDVAGGAKPLSVGVQSVIELRSRRSSITKAGPLGRQRPGSGRRNSVDWQARPRRDSVSPAHSVPTPKTARDGPDLEVGGCSVGTGRSPPLPRQQQPRERRERERPDAPPQRRRLSSSSVGASRVRSQSCSGPVREADPAAAAEAAKARVRSFERKRRQEDERRLQAVQSDTHKLQEEKRREEQLVLQRRSEIYALNALLAHVETRKQALFDSGVLSSMNNGV